MEKSMSVDDIDLDRIVVDADYRRLVIEFLNQNDHPHGSDDPVVQEAATAPLPQHLIPAVRCRDAVDGSHHWHHDIRTCGADWQSPN
jgi:hypothetical protein